MLNKFIFSGLVQDVDEKESKVSFNVLIPDGNSMLMQMVFSKEICSQIKEAMKTGQVLICTEGYAIPDNEGKIAIRTTNISTTTIPFVKKELMS